MLSQTDRKPLYINPSHVVAVVPADAEHESIVYTTMGKFTVIVPVVPGKDTAAVLAGQVCA
jgi:hypothetical protein